MPYFIVDEVKKSIHCYDDVIPRLCQISAIDNNQKIILFSENDLMDLLLYEDYNGCPYCLKKYYLEKITAFGK